MTGSTPQYDLPGLPQLNTLRCPSKLNGAGGVNKGRKGFSPRFARMAIKTFIDEYGDNSEKPFSKAKHLLGVVESGVNDLGQRHSDHLIQKIVGYKDRLS